MLKTAILAQWIKQRVTPTIMEDARVRIQDGCLSNKWYNLWKSRTNNDKFF